MTQWWQAPSMRREGDEGVERKVGFIDLFYDLIFVVVVAQLAHDLAHHPDWKHLWQFGLSFAAVWWLWIGHTFYTDRFETNDVSHRLFTFFQMIPVVGLAVFAHGAYGDTALPFSVAYMVGRVFIIYLWWRGGRHDAEAKHLCDGYVAGFTLGLLPWVASVFAPLEVKPFLWALGLVIDLATPSVLRQRIAALPKFSHSRLAERFGLFTIIVLGESVAGTVNGLGGLDTITGMDQLTGLLAMLLAFLLWWIYFEMVPREELQPSHISAMLRSYLHYPLLAAIAASGAGVLSIVGHGQGTIGGAERWLLAGSVAVAFAAMLGLSRVHVYQPYFVGAQRRTELSLVFGIAACVFIGAFASGGPVAILLLLVAVAAVPLVWGISAWARIDAQSSK